MPRPKKPKPAYYHVFASPDGTIAIALPRPRPKRKPGAKQLPFDEDGCFNWSDWDWNQPGITDWTKTVTYGAIANNLNLKKTLRARVENRLDRIEATLAEVAAGLRRLEERDGQGANRGLKSRREGSVGDGA